MSVEIKLQHLLDAVGTENYIRYGISGPQRFVLGDAMKRVPSPKSLVATISLLAAKDQMTHVLVEALRFGRQTHVPERQTVWAGTTDDGQLRALWVWDFFRMTSHIVLVLESDDPTLLAASLHPLLERQSNDQIIFAVNDQAGHIRQVHLIP